MKLSSTTGILLSFGILLTANGYSVGVGTETDQQKASFIRSSPVKDDSTQNGSTEEDSNFFHGYLSREEQIWMMNTSLIIALQEIDPTNDVIQEQQVPSSLTPKFVNGQIPNNFQKRFSQWLVEEHKLTPDHFRALIKGQEACGEKVCSDLPGFGGSCCPFG